MQDDGYPGIVETLWPDLDDRIGEVMIEIEKRLSRLTATRAGDDDFDVLQREIQQKIEIILEEARRK